LAGLVPHLPESLLAEALEIARTIGNEYERGWALHELTYVLTPTNVDRSLWEPTLHALGTLTRPDFLASISTLVPLILHFGGVAALQQISFKPAISMVT
jgi:hypothetical protein